MTAQLVSMTSKRQAKGSCTIRSVGSALVVVWCSAFLLCVAHCTLGIGQCGAGESKGGSCHGAANSSSPGPKEAPTNLFCNAFEQGRIARHVIVLDVPAPLVLFILSEYKSVADQPEIDLAGVLRRQQTSSRLFTPEVYLGPAFRSLAPPSIQS